MPSLCELRATHYLCRLPRRLLPAACLRYLAAWLLAAWLPAIACYRLPAACYTQRQILVECLWLTA